MRNRPFTHIFFIIFHFNITEGLKPIGMNCKPGNDDSKGIFTLRSLEDVNNIIIYFKELTDKNNSLQLNIVLIGGSFIAMESVCYFIEKNAKTTIISRHKPFEKLLGNLFLSPFLIHTQGLF